MISYLEFMYKYEGSVLILVRDLSTGVEVENSLDILRVSHRVDSQCYVMEMML